MSKRKRENFFDFVLSPPPERKPKTKTTESFENFVLEIKDQVDKPQLESFDYILPLIKYAHGDIFLNVLLPFLEKLDILHLCCMYPEAYELCANKISNFYEGYFDLESINLLGDPDLAEKFFYPKMLPKKPREIAKEACTCDLGTVLLTMIKHHKLDVNLKKYNFFKHAKTDSIRLILIDAGWDIEKFLSDRRNNEMLITAVVNNRIKDIDVFKLVYPHVLKIRWYDRNYYRNKVLNNAFVDKNTEIVRVVFNNYEPNETVVANHARLGFKIALKVEDLLLAAELYPKFAEDEKWRDKVIYDISNVSNVTIFSTLVWSDERLLSPNYYNRIVSGIIRNDALDVARFYFPQVNTLLDLKPLKFAVQCNAVKIVKFLLDEIKIPINDVIDARKSTMKRNLRKLCSQKVAVSPDVNSVVAFKAAVRAGMRDLVKTFIKSQNIDPSLENNWAVKCACRHKDVEVLKALLSDSRVDVNCDNGYLIKKAYELNSEMISYIIKRQSKFDCTVDNNWMMRRALVKNLKGENRWISMRPEYLRYLAE